MKLAEEIHGIFLSMLPSFVQMAKKYNAPNPEDWAQEWQTRAFLIALKFDEGTLTKKGLEEGVDGLTENVDEAAFLRSFRGYLMTSYKNDLNALFAKNKNIKNVPLFTDEGETIAAIPASRTETVLQNPIYITDILSVVSKDVKRNEKSAKSNLKSSAVDGSPTEACTWAFETSMKQALEAMIRQWDGVPILASADQEFESANIAIDFMPEWREKTKFALAHQLLAEQCPFTAQKIGAVLFSEQDFALTKRFERYLLQNMGGMSARIKRDKK